MYIVESSRHTIAEEGYDMSMSEGLESYES